eukprot:Amastigsp_a509796_52.p2 type:complete len:132 gc:universal Amastigsp_a509796_52:381-776(+)
MALVSTRCSTRESRMCSRLTLTTGIRTFTKARMLGCRSRRAWGRTSAPNGFPSLSHDPQGRRHRARLLGPLPLRPPQQGQGQKGFESCHAAGLFYGLANPSTWGPATRQPSRFLERPMKPCTSSTKGWCTR